MTRDEAIKILNLQDDFTLADLKKAYRTLAMKYHPDSGSGNVEEFIKIKNAYEYLLKSGYITGEKVLTHISIFEIGII